MKKTLLALGVIVLLIVAAGLVVVWVFRDKDSGPAMDEAMAAGKKPSDFPAAANDFFHDMDGGVAMNEAQVKGRNTWIVWTAGNEAFWDYLANHSFGTFDLVKTLSSYPCTPAQVQELRDARAKTPRQLPDYRLYSRNTRFKYLGLMNEPEFTQPTAPDEFGLCLDKTSRAPDFDEKVYGRSSGVIGLRLFPNPNFDQAARAKWNATRFYTDPAYYSDSTLVRPYRVGMGCAFCHISFHPNYPPDDPENPAYRNLSATIGAQYFWFGRIFASNLTPDSFVWHLVDSAQPGTVDTSFIPTDHINNPRALNAIFNLTDRLDVGNRLHKETMAGGALASLPQVKKIVADTKSPTFGTPHILWDGADSVQIDAALTRVFINIGEFHQEWIRHIQPIVGGRPQSPIEVAVAQQNSTFWNATQERSADLAQYLIKAGAPMRLKDAPGGEQYLRGSRAPADYDALVARGKTAFAENCARCHSSKLPDPIPPLEDDASCKGPNYLDCWKKYWDATETPDFKAKMRDIVAAPDFLERNYLSTDARIPVTTLETEICSSMASNALEGYVWDNFSSQTYKTLPALGDVKLDNPITGETLTWSTPGGGRGYMRVPSLISVWATAPFLHNNEIGVFTNDPSVAGRMRAFDDAIQKLLWPARRAHTVRRTREVDTEEGKFDGTSGLNVYTTGLPSSAQLFVGDSLIARSIRTVVGAGSLVSDGRVTLGPIPAGTPVNLLANINFDKNDPRFSIRQLLSLLDGVKHRLQQIQGRKLSPDETTALLKELVPNLIKLSTCPDFIVDRGHNFGTNLPDADKEALIEFIKTF
jgi:hypothetical protein